MKILNAKLCLILFVFILCFYLQVLPNPFLHIKCDAADETKVQKLTFDFVPESGCPASVVEGICNLDLDPFNAPIDARIYITYKCEGSKSIEAIKFRLRFVDSEGQNCGTFQAADGHILSSGEQTQQKWRREGINPKTVGIKCRILKVRYTDGQLWQSSNMPDVIEPGSEKD